MQGLNRWEIPHKQSIIAFAQAPVRNLSLFQKSKLPMEQQGYNIQHLGGERQ